MHHRLAWELICWKSWLSEYGQVHLWMNTLSSGNVGSPTGRHIFSIEDHRQCLHPRASEVAYLTNWWHLCPPGDRRAPYMAETMQQFFQQDTYQGRRASSWTNSKGETKCHQFFQMGARRLMLMGRTDSVLWANLVLK